MSDIEINKFTVYAPDGFNRDLTGIDGDRLCLSDVSSSKHRVVRLTVGDKKTHSFDAVEEDARHIRDLLTAWLDAPSKDTTP